jgi:hypothetical protein
MTEIKGRRGPWSQADKDFIESNYDKLTPEEIAMHLERDPKAIKKYLKDNQLINYHTEQTRFNLQKSIHWQSLKGQFEPNELDIIVYHWNETIKQFKDDVLHTEELQIIDMVKLEALMNRLLTDEHQTKKRIQHLEETLDQEQSKDKELRDVDVIRNCRNQIVALYNAISDIGKQYKDYMKEKAAILNKIKGTRDQRIKEIENSKETLTGWVKALVNRPELRERMGRDMEKMRLAMEVEFERLSDYHTYLDGEVDQPFLTPENTKGGE